MWLKILLLIFFSKESCHSEEVTDAPKIEPRIVDGQNAIQGQFPWMVALSFQGQFVCGGSIISSTIVLTAAHCIVSETEVRLPEHFSGKIGDINKEEGFLIEFISYAVHEYYQVIENEGDIAIFKTKQPIPFSNTVQPICIASKPLLGSTNPTAMGWGMTNAGYDATILQYGEQKIIPHEICLRDLPGHAERGICTIGTLPSAAPGDSGGPLIVYVGSEPVQIGVANGLVGFEDRIVPGYHIATIFASVASYYDWITAKANVPDICTI